MRVDTVKFNTFQDNRLLKISLSNNYILKSFDDVLVDDSRNFPRIDSKDILVYGLTPVVDQSETFIAGYTDEFSLNELEESRIIFGDHTKVLKYIDFNFVKGADGTKVLKRKNINDNIKYLYFCLQFMLKYLPELGYSRNFKNLKQLIFPIPNVKTQNIIVNMLEKNHNIISTRQAQIEAMDELIQSVFYEMFEVDYPMKLFPELVKIDTKTVNDFSEYADKYYIGVENIEKDTGKIVEPKLVKDSNIKSTKNYFNANHLLYSKIRPNLNKVANPSFSGITSTDVFPLLPNSEINKYYLLYVLRGSRFLAYATENMTGANIPRINKAVLNAFEIPLPPIDLQNQFAEKVKAIEKQKAKMQKSLEEMQTLFDALMQKAFSGGLRNI
ncbi:MAG: restriction endonuclease subunit S [Saccharofermentanales bacterium]